MIEIEQAARLLMITAERIRQLAKEGYIPKPIRGLVPLVGTVQGYIRFLKDEERRASKSASAARLHDARTRETELRIAERDHRLIDLEEHDAVFDEAFGGLRSALLSLPQRVTRDREVRRKIEVELDTIFARVATGFAEAGKNLRAIGRANPEA